MSSSVQKLSTREYAWPVVLALLTPLGLTSAYLLLSRWPVRWFTTTSDRLGLAVSVAVGIWFLWQLPIRSEWRLLLSVAYALLAAYVLFFYSFLFVGFVFGDWL